MTGEIKVGDRFRDPSDGEVVEIESVSDGNITRIRGVRGPLGGCDPQGSVPWTAGPGAFHRIYSERAPTAPPPASSESAPFDLRNAESRARGLHLGAFVRSVSEVSGVIASWTSSGDPIIETDAFEAWRACPAETVSISARDESPDESEPEEDHKPRGVKPPLALIPWEVVPDAWAPAVVRETLDPARVIAVLLETQGDALIDDVARAFSHGAAKYGIDNWREIAWTPQAALEYRSAMLRHLYADAIGEALDPDSGVSHLAHACASAMIYAWHETRDARAEGAQ